jgi:hypothetical protein
MNITNNNNMIQMPQLHRGVSAASDISTFSWLHEEAPPLDRLTSDDILCGLHPLASDDIHSDAAAVAAVASNTGAFPSNLDSVFSSLPDGTDEVEGAVPGLYNNRRGGRTRGGWENGMFVSPKVEALSAPSSHYLPHETHTLRRMKSSRNEKAEEILSDPDPENGDTDMSSPESNSPRAVMISEGYHSYQKTVSAKPCTKTLSFRERKLFVTNQSKNGSLYMILHKPAGLLHGRIELMTNSSALEEANNGDDDEKVSLNRFCRGREKDYIIKDNDTVAMFRILRIPDHEKTVSPTKNIIGSFQDMKRSANGWSKVLNCRFGGLRILGRTVEGQQHDVLGSTRVVLPEEEGSYLIVFYPLQGLMSKASQTKIMKRPLQRIGLYLEKTNQVFAGSSFIMCTKDPRPRIKEKEM